ncbi:MAG: hypothetical protein JXJ17_16590 [Anaerolineae bacterium]|nr:hypothetical protein [Anaerolineae bacterium]
MIKPDGKKVVLFVIALLAVGVILSACGSEPVEEPDLYSAAASYSDSLPDDGDVMAASLVEVLGGHGLFDYNSDEYVQLFTDAAAGAELVDASPMFYLLEGDIGIVLAIVDWYGQYRNYQFLVIEPDGSVTFAGQTDDLATILDAQWLGDTWAVVTSVGSGMYVVKIHLIGQQDGQWVQFYPSEEGSEPLVSAPDWPMAYFSDGYRSLTISYMNDSSSGGVSVVSPMVEYHFEWQDDHYVEIGGE